MLTKYKLYVGSNRYKLKSPSFVGKGSFVKGLAVSLSEVVSAHVNVSCFDGGDGSVTVGASGGTPPYQYSIDPTFATYNADGVFSNLSLVGPVDEGTDQYGGILISHRRFYVRDASGQIVSCVVDLKSPVELDWLNNPGNMTVFCDPGQNYATKPFDDLLLTTTANNARIISAGGVYDTYNIGKTPVQYVAIDSICRKRIYCNFYITVLPLYYPNAIQDYDGNWYDAVVIGNQVWLASNLRTTHYADGTPIPAGGSTTSDTDPYYYDCSSSGIPLKDRGYLYNWPAVMKGSASSDLNPSGVQGIAPTGCHVPSDAEWTQLTDYVNSQSVYRYNNESGKIAKALAYNDYWDTDNTPGNVGNDQSSNNATLFGAVPNYSYTNVFGYFWTTTKVDNNYAQCYEIYSRLSKVAFSGRNLSGRYQVRCVCDLSPMDFAAWYYNEYGSYNHQLPTE